MNLETWWAQKRCNDLSHKTFIEIRGEKKYLLANFSETEQKKDIERSAYTIGDFYRTKDNLKVKDPKNPFAWKEAIMSDSGFDMPQWASVKLRIPIEKCAITFMPQTKTCNVNCPWCFVDDRNKNGKKENGEYFSTREIIDALEEIKKEKEIHSMRRSGGEPLLLPWQWLENLEELTKRGLNNEIFFQGETNLTTGHFVDYLQKEGRLNKNFWKEIGKYNNFGVLCSFKGTDVESHLRAIGFVNLNGEPDKRFAFLEEERWYTFRRMVDAGIDAYPFIYDPNPKTIKTFLERGISEYGTGFVSKTWIYPLKLYGPEKTRLAKKNIKHEEFQKTLDENFIHSKEIMQELVPRYTGHQYKAIPRTEIKLKSK